MSKTAFMFPGQGSQCVGMGADFYEACPKARAVYDMASELIGIDMKKLCFEENEKLDITEYTQAALVTTCLAMTRAVEEKGLFPDITAGLSLGEYSAIAAAGGMMDTDAIRLVRKRGILMQNAVPPGVGAMCAVMAPDAEKIENELKMMDGVSVANYNCPGQIVITGRKERVEAAAEKLKEAGAKRTVMLNVSGPFHSPLLVPAGEKLAQELENTKLFDLKIPYVTNVTAQTVEDISLTRELLARQVSAPVRWMQSMELMIASGIDIFVEIGPGKTLSGFIRRIDRNVKCFNVGTWEEAEKAAEQLC